MTSSAQNKLSGFFRGTLAVITLAALIAFTLPQGAEAASGGATIYNTVKVTYSSGTTANLFATANLILTVNTVPAAPTVTNPANQTVAAGGAASYVYILKSNSNGLDTYNTSALTNAPTNVGAATGTSVTASVQLWGGNAVGSVAGAITVPYGTTTGLTLNTSTIQIGANQYTVTGIAAGTAASTNGSGDLVAEVPATLTLTPINGAPGIIANSVAAGTQVGEFKAAELTALLTAGTPTTPGTDGSYSTTYTISTTATPVVNFPTVPVITTVSAARVTITKTANPATNVNPGGTITYTITVTNTHASLSASSVTVIDPVPAYTTYTANSTTLNGIAVNGDGATSPLVAPGLLVDSNTSRTGGVLATGTLPALGVATIVYSVVVQ